VVMDDVWARQAVLFASALYLYGFEIVSPFQACGTEAARAVAIPPAAPRVSDHCRQVGKAFGLGPKELVFLQERHEQVDLLPAGLIAARRRRERGKAFEELWRGIGENDAVGSRIARSDEIGKADLGDVERQPEEHQVAMREPTFVLAAGRAAKRRPGEVDSDREMLGKANPLAHPPGGGNFSLRPSGIVDRQPDQAFAAPDQAVCEKRRIRAAREKEDAGLTEGGAVEIVDE